MAPDRNKDYSAAEALQDLSPHAPRTPVFVIGVGGTGQQALVGLTEAMDATGLRFDQKSSKTSRVVSAMLIDGNLDEVSPRSAKENPEAWRLAQAGVKMVSLSIPDFDDVLIREKIKDKITPGFLSDTDTEGCKGDGRVGLVRYTLLRKGIGAEDGINPVQAMTEVVRGWKEVSTGTDMGPQVRLVVVMGTHGGTGPAGLAVVADAISVMRRLLPGKQIVTDLVMMSGESAQINRTMSGDGNREKRDFNSLVTGLRVNDMTFRGGLELPDGEFVGGVPQWVTIVDAQSNECSVDTGDEGHYQPVRQASKAIVAGITGRHTGSARSNIGLEIPQPDRDAAVRSLKRFSWMGVAEAQPEPTRQTMALAKKRRFFYEAAGLGDAQEAIVREKLPQFELEAVIREILDSEEVDVPTLSRAELEPEQAANNVSRVLSTVEQNLIQFKADIQRSSREQWSARLQALFGAAQELLAAYGVTTALRYTTEWQAGAEALEAAIGQEIEVLRRSKEDYQNLVEDQKIVIQNLGTPSILPIKRGMDERKIRNAVDGLSSTVKQYIDTVANLEVLERLSAMFRAENGILTNVRTIQEKTQGIHRNAVQVYDAISAEKIGFTTPFDISVDVDVNFAGNPAELRAQMGNWSQEDMESVVHGIGLEANDYNLVDKLRGRIDIMEALVRRSSPLVRTTQGLGTKHRKIVREVTVPVDQSAKLRVSADGEIISGSNGGLPIPDRFRGWATTVDGGYMVTQESHGGELLEDPYFFEAMKEFLGLSREDRMKFFLTEAEHDRLLVPFAQRFAQMQMDEQGGKGEIYTDAEGLPRYRREVKPAQST